MISTTLPSEAVAKLTAAAKTPNTDADPLARQKAIEKVTAELKQKYPQFYKEEELEP